MKYKKSKTQVRIQNEKTIIYSTPFNPNIIQRGTGSWISVSTSQLKRTITIQRLIPV